MLSESKLDFENPTIEWHSELTRSSLLESLAGAIISEPNTLQINGRPAVKFEIRGTTEGFKIVYLHTTVDTGQHLHQILAWTLPSYYDSNREELELVISSFKASSQ